MDGKSREFSSVMVFEKKCAVCGTKKTIDRSLLKCKGCNSVRYCGKQHQKEHWKLHKIQCKDIAARQKEQEVEEINRLNELFDDGIDIIQKNNAIQFKNFIKKHPEIVNFECEEYGRCTLIFASVVSQNIDAVKALLDAGEDINIREKNGLTPIYMAIQVKNVPIVKMLLEHDANVNIIYNHEDTLLHVACIGKNYSIVKLLLENNININVQDDYGFTALAYACRDGTLPIVKLLLQTSGIDVNLATIEKLSPLQLACFYPETAVYKEIVTLLLQKEANVHAKNIHSGFSLFFASENGSTDIMKLLLDNGAIADINCQNEVGYSPLIVACENRKLNAVKLLLQYNVDMYIFNQRGASALHLICEDGFNDILEILIENKIDINIRSKCQFEYTPLMIACQQGHRETVKLLLQYNPDITILSPHNGSNAIQIAARNGFFDIIEILSNYSKGQKKS